MGLSFITRFAFILLQPLQTTAILQCPPMVFMGSSFGPKGLFTRASFWDLSNTSSYREYFISIHEYSISRGVAIACCVMLCYATTHEIYFFSFGTNWKFYCKTNPKYIQPGRNPFIRVAWFGVGHFIRHRSMTMKIILIIVGHTTFFW